MVQFSEIVSLGRASIGLKSTCIVSLIHNNQSKNV